jgi:hypothetical protein
MQNRIVTALAARLRAHISLSKSRLETLCLLIVGAIGARTVNLGHVATERGGGVKPASTYRRLQRFFQFFALAPDWAAPLLAATLGTERWTLVLDRTNWKIGRSEVNYLVLAAVTRRRRVPLLWTLLPHGGGSASADRIALMHRYLAQFPVASIRLLLGDREFIGAEWLKFLNDNNVPFAIRIRDNLRVTDEAGHELTLHARLHRARRSRVFDARLGAGEDAAGMPLLHFAARHIEREWLIVVSNRPARAALEAYRKRIRHCRSDQWRNNGSSSSASSPRPRPAASTWRTPASPIRASSTCSWPSSPWRWPGPPPPPPRSSAPAPQPARRTATRPSPGSASASTISDTSSEPRPTPRKPSAQPS